MRLAGVRRRPERRRAGRTYEFDLGGGGCATVTEFADGGPAELFLTWGKQGSTLQGLCDALAISVSLGLQHGVPLAEFAARLTHLRFEPAGATGDPQLPWADSVIDYLFRRLSLDHPFGGPVVAQGVVRRRPERRRAGRTYEFDLGGGGCATVTEFADGGPAELFLTWGKQGSTLQGLCDALAISVSLGLQHGVPLAEFAARLTHLRFEPAGATGDPQLPWADSLIDYLFRRLTLDFSRAGCGDGTLSTHEAGIATRAPVVEGMWT